MPARNKYGHYKLSKSSREALNISAFGGVDFSNQKLQVSSHRAIDLLNFLYKDGVVQKREGYTQKAVVPTIKYIAYPNPTTTILSNENNKSFNGIWRFLAEDGEYHIIAHIGKVLFEIKKINEKIVDFELLSVGKSVGSDALFYQNTYEHLDQKSMAFVGANRLWFLGGNKYMVIGFRSDGRLIYEPVEESSLTYIPTTTTSITYKNSVNDEARQSFDYGNLMTMWRQNTCLSGTGKKEEDVRRTKYYEYTLDAPIKLKDTEDDVAAIQENKVLSSISTETQRQLAKITIKIDEILVEEEEEE